HQIVDLPNPPSIQVGLGRPHHRHPNPIEPPPRKGRPNLTFQPRTPRPPRHQRFPATEAPPVLQHPELRMHCRPTHPQVDRRLLHPLNPKERLKVRQPPHPRLHPNLPTRKTHPPNRLNHLRNGPPSSGDCLLKSDASESRGFSSSIDEVGRPERKEGCWARGCRAYPIECSLLVWRTGYYGGDQLGSCHFCL